MFKRPLSRRIALGSILTTSAVVATFKADAAPAATKISDLQTAIDSLRVAMINGDGKALEVLLHDHVNYMHSSGHSQTKIDLLRDLAGKKFFAQLTYSEQTVDVIGNTATVVQTVDQVKNLPAGKTRASKIKVLQTWLYAGGRWKLLSRMSAIIYSPLTTPSRCTAPTARKE